jgi:hypothetical protein
LAILKQLRRFQRLTAYRSPAMLRGGSFQMASSVHVYGGFAASRWFQGDEMQSAAERMMAWGDFQPET